MTQGRVMPRLCASILAVPDPRRALVVTGAPFAQPDRDQDARDQQEDERFDESAREPPVGDYPCESSHSPPTEYSTISPSIGY